ncbi:MAG TPA: hypothetical protein VEI25_11185 [Paraburkholderia sp.]|nr:hypothetical protein [Paraburkholderia sp.]
MRGLKTGARFSGETQGSWHASTANNLTMVVQHGLNRTAQTTGVLMPAFATEFTEERNRCDGQ